MTDTKKALIEYVNRASELADNVKRNVHKGGTIDNKTVISLNKFIIAANEISEMTEQLTNEPADPNIKLN